MTKTNTAAVVVEATEVQSGEPVTKVIFDQGVYDALLLEHKTISGVIRHLASGNMSRGDIAKVTGKRYQHVRNVLITPLKK